MVGVVRVLRGAVVAVVGELEDPDPDLVVGFVDGRVVVVDGAATPSIEPPEEDELDVASAWG